MIYKGKRLQTNGFITQLSDKLDVILKMQSQKQNEKVNGILVLTD